MPETPTPGQVNFEAFLRALVPPGQTPWHWLGDAEHAAWEAAAQAVLPPFPGLWQDHCPPLLYLLRVWRDQTPPGPLRAQLETTIQALHVLTAQRHHREENTL